MGLGFKGDKGAEMIQHAKEWVQGFINANRYNETVSFFQLRDFCEELERPAEEVASVDMATWAKEHGYVPKSELDEAVKKARNKGWEDCDKLSQDGLRKAVQSVIEPLEKIRDVALLPSAYNAFQEVLAKAKEVMG